MDTFVILKLYYSFYPPVVCEFQSSCIDDLISDTGEKILTQSTLYVDL